MKIIKIIEKTADEVQRLLWPETCPFCGNVCAEGVCDTCRRKVEGLLIEEPKCMQCGKPVRYTEQEYCTDCVHTHHYYDRGVALWLHKSPVNTSIYRFKYHNQRVYAKFYAQEIVKEYGGLIRNWNPQLIVPVPLHFRRRRKRGYNQAELLAEEIGRLIHIPVGKDLVRRVHYTNPQKQLDPKHRKKNLEHAFAPGIPGNGWRLRGKRTLIIDDIYTTGNTIDQVAKILRIMGAQKVYFLTISIGQGY